MWPKMASVVHDVWHSKNLLRGPNDDGVTVEPLIYYRTLGYYKDSLLLHTMASHPYNYSV